MDDKKIVGTSYIVVFYQNVMNLTGLYSSYLNLMLEFENKYPSNGEVGPTESDRAALNQVVQVVRQEVHKVFVQYRCIFDNLKVKKEDKVISDAYGKIKSEFIIDRDCLDVFVMGMNKAIVDDVISSILESSQDILGKVYDEGEPGED